MKLFSALFLLLSLQAYAYEKVQINGKIYVAQGFDDNDMVELTVVGTLPNSCYRNPSFTVERNDPEYKVTLWAYYVPAPEGCREVSIAYSETINFGMLNAGKYDITLENKSGSVKKELKVAHATSGLVDEFLYGNVTGIGEEESSREIELMGVNPANCLVFEDLKSDIQDGVIVLRPQFKEVGVCENKPTPFKIKYTVPYLANQPKGVMIHVRVMNGRSFNYLFQNLLK